MRRVTGWLLLLILIFTGTAGANDIPEPVHRALIQGKEALYHFRLQESRKIFHRLQEQYPQLPHGYFYQAYVLMVYYSQDETNDTLATHLMNLLDQAVDVGEAFREQHPEQPEPYFYLGLAHGLKGIYYVINRSYLKAYYYGRKGKNYLARTVEMDSNYVDALLGLGIFHYYVDLMPGILKIFAAVLGFEGDRTKGLAEISRTMTRGTYFRVEAEFVYASLRYFMEGEVWDALTHFEKLDKEYPENPGVKLVLGYHYRRYGEILPAIRQFQRVSDKYKERLPEIYVIKYYNLAVCYFLQNQFTEAEKTLELLLKPGLRKSPFYLSAITYYKGVLAKMRMNEPLARKYFTGIPLNKHTGYWYHASRFYLAVPSDSLLYYYTVAENDIFTGNLERAHQELEIMDRMIEQGKWQPATLTFSLLVRDVHARFYFKQARFEQAAQIYREILPQISRIPDEFQRAWIYIRYARVLRFLKKWELAESMLEKARVSDEEYTRFMIERELFIVHKHQKS